MADIESMQFLNISKHSSGLSSCGGNLFILYLSSDTNINSKYLQEELKGKSSFVQ